MHLPASCNKNRMKSLTWLLAIHRRWLDELPSSRKAQDSSVRWYMKAQRKPLRKLDRKPRRLNPATSQNPKKASQLTVAGDQTCRLKCLKTMVGERIKGCCSGCSRFSRPSRERAEQDQTISMRTGPIDSWAETRWSIRSSVKLWKTLVGERGFEPPTPWSRRLVSRRINSLARLVCVAIL